MLPEHVRELRKMAKELNKVPQRAIDEQQLEEFERILNEAIEYKQSVTIYFWDNGEVYFVYGVIQAVNVYRKEIKVLQENEDAAIVSLIRIIDISLH